MKWESRHAEHVGDGTDVPLAALEQIATYLGNQFGPKLDEAGIGFCFMVFNFSKDEDKQWSVYTTNAEPRGMIEGIRELADKREEMLNAQDRRGGDVSRRRG